MTEQAEEKKINPLGMKSLAESMNVPIGKQLGNIFKLDWIFDKWYEKVILIIMMLLSFYSLWRIIFG